MSHSHHSPTDHTHSSSCTHDNNHNDDDADYHIRREKKTNGGNRGEDEEGIGNPTYLLPPSLQEEYTLRNEFFRAEQLYHHIEGNDTVLSSSSSSSSTEVETTLLLPWTVGSPCTHHSLPIHIQDALQAFFRCSDMIRREAIFSTDEIVEDINTEDLRYLLTEYYIALLRMKQESSQESSTTTTSFSSAQQRLQALTLAKIGLEIFIDQMFQYGIISDNERNTSFGGWTKDKDDYAESSSRTNPSSSSSSSSFETSRDYSTTTSSSAASRNNTVTTTALDQQRLMRSLTMGNALRNQKIERFKRNQACKKRLTELSATTIRQRQIEILIRKKKQGKNTNTEEDTIPDGVTSNNGYAPDPDEEIVREIALLELAIAARNAADEILSINQEIPLLHHALQLQEGKDEYSQRKQYEQEQQYNSKHGKSSDNTIDGIPINDISIRPDRPGIEITRIDPTYTVVKETIKADIFKSGHRPPTMGMEEWGDIVMQRTHEREAREAIQSQNRVATMEEIIEEGKEDNEALFDAATYRKRGFEDWADGVPKGSGNTKRI